MSEVQDSAVASEKIGSKLGPLVDILAVFGVAGLVLTVGLPWAGDNPLRFQAVVWIANIGMLGAVWVALRRQGKSWSHIGLRLNPGTRSIGAVWGGFWRSLVVLASALAGWVLGAVVMVNITGRPEQADMSGYNFLSGNLPMLLLVLVGVFIASSMGEEILYRGFLITRLEELGGGRKGALRGAVLASAIVFGLIHFAWGPMGMVQTTFMGLALGVSYLVLKRSLWILILAHFYMDAVLMVQMYLAPAG